jgi:hypothetical protein
MYWMHISFLLWTLTSISAVLSLVVFDGETFFFFFIVFFSSSIVFEFITLAKMNEREK